MRVCPKCKLRKTEALFDKNITYCKKCITEVCASPITKGKVKNYADYLEEDKKKRYGKN